ncbi:hypothetical protein [Nocardia sp. CDC160]|uniref:hypothetical protein n=1 Tax=Nocardia sp. CDC160 TaxID=3112166 RepID=UPI002DBFABCC|nr:hypothetical protein [Nocardia sp. CDC160]MEC3916651.1 hypothetical protein [Nocardia sp. CDC160]
MSAPEKPPGSRTVDELYRTLLLVHSPLAATLIVVAVTGELPPDVTVAGPR